MIESGLFYNTVIDPLLTSVRHKVANTIRPGQKILDVACGTGAQVFELAQTAKEVVGIDLSESMIKKAEQSKQKRNVSNVQFRVCDATGNWKFADKQFNIAILSLALHQFPPENYSPVLKEMKRVAHSFIFVDYAVPLPGNFVGLGSRVAEFFAGREHHRNFRQYNRLGGLPGILEKNNFSIQKENYFTRGAFQLVVCSETEKS